jgi:uncharacterized DUF497 family protein
MAPEWDERKRQWTIRNRDLDFADAVNLDLLTATTRVDSRRPYGETRFVSTGYLGGQLCVLVWTLRERRLRVISLRKANDREKKTYADDAGRPPSLGR